VNGEVVFGAAYQTWGFSLKTMAKFYAAKDPIKFSIPIDKLMKILWQKENFVNLIVRPINILLNACQAYPDPLPNGKTLDDAMKIVGIRIGKDDYDLKGLKLIRKVMNAWLPISNTIIELAVDHLPSPKIAQSYRADLLYKGPKDDIYYNAIKNCDSTGPLIVYISKMVPTKDNSRFYAFGRVFAGSATSSKVKILLNDHDPSNQDHRKTFMNDTIQRVLLMMANKIEPIEAIPAGNILGIDGIDKTMIKSGTVVDDKSIQCYPLKNIAFSVSPVVQYALRPKNTAELSKFVEQMKKFVKSDPCLQYFLTKDGEHILAGAGELHLEVAIEQLRTDFLKGIEFEKSEPIVPYCETITGESSRICLAKSPNKHNRLYFVARPLNEKLVKMMIEDDLPKDSKERARVLMGEFGFGDEARKIWKLGPELDSCNILLDDTKGVQYLNEIRDTVSTGFIGVCEGGPLCDEPVRGVTYCLKDVNLHADAIHRGAGQLMPATRRVLFASMLTAKPRLLEPVFSVEIRLPRDMVSSLYGLMIKRRGAIKTVDDENIGNVMRVEAELPVAESFGYIEELRSVTSGMAFATLSFSHWQVVPGDPMEDGSYANVKMMEIRKRKGMKVEKPVLEEFFDKL
jgi:elongation factor 2